MKQLLFLGKNAVFAGVPLQIIMAYVLTILVICGIGGLLVLYSTSSPYPKMERADSEKCFVDPSNGRVEVFPSIFEAPSVDITVVVPAYEEETRLPRMLDECLDYLESKAKKPPATVTPSSTDQEDAVPKRFSYEVIVVDDGSSDRTSEVAFGYAKKMGSGKVRVLTLTRNRGKGGAVYMGVMSARGKYVLFADADGATQFCDVTKLEAAIRRVTVDEVNDMAREEDAELEISAEGVAMPRADPAKWAWEKPAIAVGSRAHLETDSIAKRSYIRTVLMYGFHFVVWVFGGCGNIKDTQCGFKLFTRQAARLCFTNLHVTRWAFDVEVLRIARHFNMKVEEVAVTWTEIDGSKLVPVWSWLQMGKDLIGIWVRYKIGAWRVLPKIE